MTTTLYLNCAKCVHHERLHAEQPCRSCDGVVNFVARVPPAGTKFDGGKPRMDLLDPLWLAEVARVLGFGAQKYAAHNWRGGI